MNTFPDIIGYEVKYTQNSGEILEKYIPTSLAISWRTMG
jgi:hypothetical protein